MKTAKTFAASVISAFTALSVLSACVSASSLELEVLEGHDSMNCFTYEKNNTVWAHLWNPYNAASLYNTPPESAYGEGIQDLIVEFSVSGVEEPFTVFPGYQAYGDEEGDNEELSIWNQDDYVSAAGVEYTYTIDRDGTYELAVPFRAMADAATDFWGENLIRVGILELCFNGIGNDDMTGFKYEGLEFEFLGVRQSKVSHSVEECAFNGGEPVKFPQEEISDETEAEEITAAETEAEAETSGSTSEAVESTPAVTEERELSETAEGSVGLNASEIIVIAAVAVVVLLAVIVVIVLKKKKK